MIKSKISIERQLNDRQFQFIVPFEASLVECLTMCEDIRNYLAGRVEEVEKKAAEEKAQAEKSKE